MIPIPYNLVIYKNHRHHVALDAHVKDRKTVASAGERPRVSFFSPGDIRENDHGTPQIGRTLFSCWISEI